MWWLFRCQGSGLSECMLSGLLSVSGKKTLLIARENYYGSASASLNLTQVSTTFQPPFSEGGDAHHFVTAL